MYNNITITGFSDEISSNVTKQFEHLNSLGIKYFDPRGIDGINISELSDEKTAELKGKMQKYDIKVACVGSPIGKIKITDPMEPHIEKLKKVIKITKELGAKYIRMFSFYIPEGEHEKYRGEVIDRLLAMVKIAEDEGVILLHENEKDIYGDTAKRCAELFEEIKSPAFGCVFDPANFVQCGETVYPDCYEILKPYITYMHIKDAQKNGDVVPAGVGAGGIKEILADLIKNGYKGFACLEPHLGSFDGLAGLELDDKMTKLEKSDESKFTLAYNSLCKILDEVSE